MTSLQRQWPRLLGAVTAGTAAVALASGVAEGFDCRGLCGSGGSAGSVTVEQVLRRADGTVPLAPATAAPIDRQRPPRVELAVFGLG